MGFRVMSEPTDDLDRVDEEPITHTIRLENVSDSGEESEGVREQNWWEDAGKQIIDGQTVYEVNSYDLRGVCLYQQNSHNIHAHCVQMISHIVPSPRLQEQSSSVRGMVRYEYFEARMELHRTVCM